MLPAQLMQFGEAALIAGAPRRDAVAQPILLHCDLAAELMMLAFFLCQYGVAPGLEGLETVVEGAGDAAVEPDCRARQML